MSEQRTSRFNRWTYFGAFDYLSPAKDGVLQDILIRNPLFRAMPLSRKGSNPSSIN